MENTNNRRKTVRVYCCGGLGVNVGLALNRALGNKQDPLYPEINVVMIDTSRANLINDSDPDTEFYHIQGDLENPTDGSGMVRKTNYPATRKAIPNILHRYEPGDFNIVISSASGGSGSVSSPAIVDKLIEGGKRFAVIVVGSEGCEKEVTNTIDTIESFVGISQKRQHPIPAIFLQNDGSGKNRNEIDSKIRYFILMLSFINSNQVARLDSQDLINFFDYTKVTNHPATLVSLEKYVEEERPSGVIPTAMLSLVDTDNPVIPHEQVAYHPSGYITDDVAKRVSLQLPVSFVIYQGRFPIYLKHYRQMAERLKAAQDTLLVNSFQVSQDGFDDLGMKL